MRGGFGSAMSMAFIARPDVSIGPARQLEVNDLVHCAESTSADAALDKVVSNCASFGVGSGHRAIRWSSSVEPDRRY